jgi:hypothetical protein
LFQRYLQRLRSYSYLREAFFFLLSRTRNCSSRFSDFGLPAGAFVKLHAFHCLAKITGNGGAGSVARSDQKDVRTPIRTTIAVGEHEDDPSDEGNEHFQRAFTRRPRHSVDAHGFEWPRSIRPRRLLLWGWKTDMLFARFFPQGVAICVTSQNKGGMLTELRFQELSGMHALGFSSCF